MVIELNARLDTVRAAAGEVTVHSAVISVVPAETAVTFPLISTVATDVVEESHVARVEMSCSDASLKTPVAVNCWVKPMFMVAGFGVTEIDWIVTSLIVSVIDAVIPWLDAVIVQVPEAATAVASPVGDMVATAESDVSQVLDDVTSRAVESE